MKIVDDYKYFVENKKLSHKITTIFLNPCFHSVVLYRLSSFFYKIKIRYFSQNYLVHKQGNL